MSENIVKLYWVIIKLNKLSKLLNVIFTYEKDLRAMGSAFLTLIKKIDELDSQKPIEY